MTTFHAQPYNLDIAGFYFRSLEEYEAKTKGLKDGCGQPVEEFEIQLTDGESQDAQLFEACKVNQASLEAWFTELATLNDNQKAVMFYLVGLAGYDVDQAAGLFDDVILYASGLRETAETIFDECHLDSVPEAIRFYIDYEKFARDLELGGELCEFVFSGKTFTVNAGGI